MFMICLRVSLSQEHRASEGIVTKWSVFRFREGDGDNSTLNMSQLMMKTLDRTANIFTAFRIPVSI